MVCDSSPQEGSVETVCPLGLISHVVPFPVHRDARCIHVTNTSTSNAPLVRLSPPGKIPAYEARRIIFPSLHEKAVDTGGFCANSDPTGEAKTKSVFSSKQKIDTFVMFNATGIDMGRPQGPKRKRYPACVNFPTSSLVVPPSSSTMVPSHFKIQARSTRLPEPLPSILRRCKIAPRRNTEVHENSQQGYKKKVMIESKA